MPREQNVITHDMQVSNQSNGVYGTFRVNDYHLPTYKVKNPI